MSAIFGIIFGVVFAIAPPLLFLWIVWRLVRHFEKEIKQEQIKSELDDWQKENL